MWYSANSRLVYKKLYLKNDFIMIKLASPDISSVDIQRLIGVLESGNLVQGVNVELFERSIASFSAIGSCSVVSSGTAALHLSLKAMGIKAGDFVIVPAFTFPATANVVENMGANTLFCDVDPMSYAMTPSAVEALIERHTDKKITAIIVVHEFGYPADMQVFAALAKKYNLMLLEDAACALGTIANGHHVGYFSDAACFSFHPRKAITTGEGGAVLSGDKALIERINCLRNHGMDCRSNQIDFVMDGLNYRMTDFQAALALGQMERYPRALKKRHDLVLYYYELLKKEERLILPLYVQGHSWQSFMVVLDDVIDRNLLIQALLNVGIQTNKGAQALNCLIYYQKKYGLTAMDFPHAATLYNRGLVLPLHQKIDKEDVAMICEELSNALTVCSRAT